MLDPEYLIALAALVTATGAALAAYVKARGAAKQDEVDLLRNEVARLHQRVSSLSLENETLHLQVNALRQENAWLYSVLKDKGIELPDIPLYIQRGFGGPAGFQYGEGAGQFERVRND